MQNILKEFYDKIYSVSSLEQYQMVISECIEELEAEGLKHVADKVRELSAVRINRFSRQATQENFELADVIKNVIDFQNTYESKSIENKHILVRVWQSNDI